MARPRIIRKVSADFRNTIYIKRPHKPLTFQEELAKRFGDIGNPKRDKFELFIAIEQEQNAIRNS